MERNKPDPIDVERAKALVRELASVLGMGGMPAQEDDRVPVTWFKCHTLVTGDQLRGARRHGRIRAERRGARWYYSRSDVRRLFPDRWQKEP